MRETWVQSLGQEDPWRRKWQPTILAWRNPMDRRAWWDTVHGVPRSGTRLNSFHLHFQTVETSVQHVRAQESCGWSSDHESVLRLVWWQKWEFSTFSQIIPFPKNARSKPGQYLGQVPAPPRPTPVPVTLKSTKS